MTDNKNYLISANTIFFLIIFFTFFSRILVELINLPQLVNLLIYPMIFLIFFLISKNNIINLNKFIILIFFIIGLINIKINDINFINLFLAIIILMFPFALTNFLIEKKNSFNINLIKKFFLFCIYLNLGTTYFQFIFLFPAGDSIKGLFISHGLGHHINGSFNYIISLILLWQFIKTFKISLFINFLAFLAVVFITDTKSIIFCHIVSILIMPIFLFFNQYNRNTILKFFLSFILALFLVLVFYFFFEILSNILPRISHINSSYLSNGFDAKLNFFRLLNSNNLTDYLFGFGPGMTSSKLAAIALEARYYNFLETINFTKSYLAESIKIIENNNFYSNPRTGSSLFQLTFSFGGVFGDFGLLGIICYLFLYLNIYRLLKKDFLIQMIFFILFVQGFIFTWLEESIYLSIIVILLFLYSRPNKKIYFI